MLKFFRLPFATTGDKTAVPDAVDSNGNVSYSQGYGFDYQRQKTDPAAKNIERDKMNQVFFDITNAIAELQSQGVPDYITSSLNGGSAYSYGQFAVVKYSGDLYISLVAANTALPNDTTKWALLPTPARLQTALNKRATAGGTSDALTAAFTPTIAALPAAPDTLSLMVRAGSANTTTTPTLKVDGTAAKTIVKGSNLPLAAGDIAGAGHWLHLDYDPTLDKFVLQNPAKGVITARAGGFSGVAQYNSSTVLTAADVGGAIALGGSGGGTITLPLLSATTAGDAITLFCEGLPWTIAPQGADTIYCGTGTIANFPIRGTEYVTFVNFNSSWVAVAGSWLSGALGVGSAWQTLTGSRVFGSNYTNNTGSSIAVSIGLIMVVNQGLELIVDNGSGIKVIDRVSGNYSANLYQTLHGVIPDGCIYQVRYFTGSGSVLDWWSELRRV